MTTMRTTLAGSIGRRTTQVAAALTLALLLGGSAARHAAAEDQQPIDSNVAAVVNDCNLQGGTATTDWTFDENGDATQAVVSCDDGANSWFECADNEGYYCDGEPPTDLTGSGGVVHHLPVLPGQLVNPPVVAQPIGHPIAAPPTSGDATIPANGGGSGTAAPSDPTPPSGGTLPVSGHAAKHHKGHKHHGQSGGHVAPLPGKAAHAASQHAKAKAARHGKHGTK